MMSSATGRKYQQIDKDIEHIDKQPNKVLSIYLSIYLSIAFTGIDGKNPYNVHLGYSIARLYQSINTKLDISYINNT